ncbi:MAG: methyltransferase regulatory domain-containing protein [Solirubrobacteraceae bacterium]
MVTAYDETPYANLPFAQTRPAVLATVATLHGLTPPDPREARVLELGCGAGANLAGIAAADPGVRAVGVDLAPTAVDVASATAAAAGLDNVAFDVADVLALTEGELGEFDYVIVHGLYAWAPEPVREAVLAACRSHLSPHGIAYLSYTAHPGGHMRQMLREMAQWHARDLQEPLARADRARGLFALLDRLGESEGPSFYAGVVGEDVHALASAPDSMLVHDLLGPTYEPVWFTAFAAAIARHGMAYVGDASPESSREPPWSPAVSAFVDEAAAGDRVAREQYFDLLVMRRFRSSLVCHVDREPAPRVDRAAVQRLLVALDGDAAPEEIRDALLDGPIPFGTLRERLGVGADGLAEALVHGFDAGAIAFSVVPSPASPVAGDRPRASGLARSQAQPGAVVTTLRNQVVRITDEPTAALLQLLDGTRDRAAILEAFPGALDAPSLDAALAKFAELGLLHA